MMDRGNKDYRRGFDDALKVCRPIEAKLLTPAEVRRAFEAAYFTEQYYLGRQNSLLNRLFGEEG